MKKNYQVPETLFWEMEVSNSFLVEDSGEIEQNLTNETETFEEDDFTPGKSPSLWD